MKESKLLEITVQARPGERPDLVAQEWMHRLNLQDGVRVAVLRSEAPTRPRRFVVYKAQLASPQHYAAATIMGPLEELLRAEGRAMDAWEILLAARAYGSPVAAVPMATISRAARLLAREGRAQPGATPATWSAAREDEEAVA